MLPSAARTQESSTKFDGRWWMTLNSEQRSAFLAGESDCYAYDVRGHRYPRDLGAAEHERVTSYYRTHPSQLDHGVLPIFRIVFRRDPHSADHGGENFPENHGVFDGEYWWQLGDKGRPYFIRGYLACQANYNRLRVTRPVAFYVQGLDRWYGYDRGMKDTGRNDKIAAVLMRNVRSDIRLDAHQP
ncbi:hypothetical protein [Phenylobacterium sp.]|uniref:hypothetical protein n=1 Tax=Phenylobacterium sp. TaxID=1871053 RepID=UPI00374CFB2C